MHFLAALDGISEAELAAAAEAAARQKGMELFLRSKLVGF